MHPVGVGHCAELDILGHHGGRGRDRPGLVCFSGGDEYYVIGIPYRIEAELVGHNRKFEKTVHIRARHWGGESELYIFSHYSHLTWDSRTHYKPKRLKKTSFRLHTNHQDKNNSGQSWNLKKTGCYNRNLPVYVRRNTYEIRRRTIRDADSSGAALHTAANL